MLIAAFVLIILFIYLFSFLFTYQGLSGVGTREWMNVHLCTLLFYLIVYFLWYANGVYVLMWAVTITLQLYLVPFFLEKTRSAGTVIPFYKPTKQVDTPMCVTMQQYIYNVTIKAR